MQLTPTIAFRGMRHSRTLESEILGRIAKLETYHPSIMACRVLVEFRERHHETGNRFHVRIDLTVPKAEIVVSHEAMLHGVAQHAGAAKLSKAAEPDPERKHVRVAIREAFNAARRQLQDVWRRQRGEVKTAVRPTRGHVTEIYKPAQYGFLESVDGHQIYFQRSAVLGNGFDRLSVGSRVSFVEEEGEKGPQASTVKLVHPRRRATLNPETRSAESP